MSDCLLNSHYLFFSVVMAVCQPTNGSLLHTPLSFIADKITHNGDYAEIDHSLAIHRS